MDTPTPKPVSEVWRPELVRLPKMTHARRAFRVFGHGLTKLVAKLCLHVTVEGLENFPRKAGAEPVLVVINHLGDSDVPALISSLPFPPDALAKVELYDLPILGKLMDWYGVIWLHRGRPDKRALRAALDGLAEGRVIVIAPEGRYSLTGALEEGNNGAAFLAYKSGAAVLPIAVTGTENETVYGNLKKFRRARVNLRVGKMFKLAGQAQGGERGGAGERQEVIAQGTRQIMEALAGLLPEKYRGAYSG
ncbi:MAG TPA: lysophospholipid acyltransferase family protein [Anaerolineales bacterium]|nr:lysophospholipid acyltransferase family protein [Anaerolineales bacterium]HMX73507.1 lysophospholipid acyltransferase family protein [Anaerolineales bacterium]HMZ41957.1 lysophospholipid acyltransferase family protein [Anaerolineales bacterium]HNA54834.1 lysophospholipid acyltransferase family protein [Anaerolineales bacterium]HNB85978.1 lysophospholipid acyltransferase family protein [Anaerolineales bacterium]